MKHALKLHGFKTDWKNLTGKIIKNSTVIIDNYGDVHPFKNGPVFHCEKMHIVNCNKNFVFYWVTRNTFPKLNHLYLLSNSCNLDIILEQKQKFQNIYLSNNYDYHSYRYRWAGDKLTKMVEVNHDIIMLEIKDFIPMPMIE
jgi:hypothetical protein